MNKNFLPSHPFAAKTATLVLRGRAEATPGRLAHRFLTDEGSPAQTFTYAGLDRRAQAIAARLLQHCRLGDRALLLCPPGLDFIAAFFACLYADVVAVPAYPPRNRGHVPRLRAILADAQPTIALTNAKTLAGIRATVDAAPEFGALHWVCTDEVPDELAADWRLPDQEGESLAFLQYTSGSTGAPKGVMVSHANILYNSLYIQRSFRLHAESVSVSWLPAFHDMGLIDGVIQPIYTGFMGVLLSPASFMQKPVRWLEAISTYRATHGGGPNFGYDLCRQKVTPEQRAGLDLSSWESAYNGAEPVRAQTLTAFAEAFRECGFKSRAFYPCYGMAETTLMVTGCEIDREPVVWRVQKSGLERGQVIAQPDASDPDGIDLVSSGRAILQTEVRIVDSETGSASDPGWVGEIWVAGPTLCQGYWRRAEDTRAGFAAQFPGEPEGRWLRTGDLGFLRDGELFVTGRLKDLIIVRGRNHYPQDIEWTVEAAAPGLRAGAGAAFSIDGDDGERLVVVQELERLALKNPDVPAFGRRIADAVAREHEVQIHEVVLIKTGTISKTSSGKLQRSQSRALYLDKALDVVGIWTNPADQPPEKPAVTQALVSQEAIAGWLKARIAALQQISPASIETAAAFSRYGLDSVSIVGLSGELAALIGREVAPTALYDYPSIDALSAHLAGSRVAVSAPAADTGRAAAADPIAVVGVGCRFPGGADNPESYWRLLLDGVDAVGEVPSDRWNAAAFYDADPDAPGKSVTRQGGFLRRVDLFDPQFFGIAPREAAAMDPQQRLLLEVAWESLEHAGMAADRLNGSESGVFVGLSTHDYSDLQLAPDRVAQLDGYAATGNSFSAAAGRISYLLGFHGPAVAVDTACSSSLVALHLACQSLRAGECSLALAGGVNVILSPALGINFSRARMMAPDGRCKAFDASADGYVRSEGCGVVVLKRLSEALVAGDRVLGVIRASAVNQDGKSNGLTAPNGPAQEAIVRKALAQSGLAPRDIGYVEAHGTGTSLGDPIEVMALNAVLGQDRPPEKPLLIGSVKSNLGHLEAAAGVASVIKALWSLREGRIPATLHFKTPNPHVPWEKVGVAVVSRTLAWDAVGSLRRAGVSSFGFTGTNAHLILEEPPLPATPAGPGRPLQLLALSARSEPALRALAAAHASALAGGASLADTCFTTNTGRAQFEHRLAAIGGDVPEMIAALRPEAHAGFAGAPPRIAFLYTGQGSQYAGMAAGLDRTEPVFRRAFDRCEEFFRSVQGGSLREHIAAGATASRLGETEFAQPALFAVAYALTELWADWGIKPALALGHSVGEYAAACAAGIFSVEDGLALIAARAWLMQRLPAGGGMTAFLTDEATVRAAAAASPGLAVAAVNGPAETVLSGPLPDLARVSAILGAQGVASRRLAVSHAFHSPLMAPMLEEFDHLLARTTFRAPAWPIISGMTGKLGAGEMATPAYWRNQALRPVRFHDGMETLGAEGIRHFLEIGPKPVLCALGRQSWAGEAAQWLPSLREGRDDHAVMLAALGSLFESGCRVEWKAFENRGAGRRISVPTYPFQRERCWIETARAPDAAKPVSAPAWRHVAGRPGEFQRDWTLDGGESAGRSALEATLDAAGTLGQQAQPLLESARFERLPAAMSGSRSLSAQMTATLRGDAVETSLWVRPEAAPAEALPWTLAATLTSRESAAPARSAAPSFGLMFFNGVERAGDRDKYRMVIEAARFADSNGFESVWVPERHYTEFGGLYPNPGIIQAALARETRRVRLMAGSIVLPLHHPLRAAEDWAVIDNLSGGRIGLSFAPGWNPGDFAMYPERYATRQKRLFEDIATVRRLWRGESIEVRSGNDEATRVRIYPTPLQKELPVWVTAAGNPQTFERAGEIGANLLTHLLDQEVPELAEKIRAYRAAWTRAGHGPAAGRVTLMVHTFIGRDEAAVLEQIRGPYCAFLKANIHLLKGLAASRGGTVDLAALSSADLDDFVGFIFERFARTRALFGTPESCAGLVEKIRGAGVDEIACLLDFGPATELVLSGLPHLQALRMRFDGAATSPTPRTPLHAGRMAAAAWEELSRAQGQGGFRALEFLPGRDGGFQVRVEGPCAADGPKSPAASSNLDEVLYSQVWQPAAPGRKRTGPAGTWLILDDESSGVGRALGDRLTRAGARPVLVGIGDRFSGSPEGGFRINPVAPDDFKQLIAAAGAPALAGVLHLWSLDLPRGEGTTLHTVRAGLNVGCAALLHLTQALDAAGAGARIHLVTRGAQAVAAGERVAVAQAPAWGLGRVVSLEHPEIWGGMIDLDPQAAPGEDAAIFGELSEDAGEDQVAFRSGARFVARLVPAAAQAAAPSRFSADGFYLITGGLGGLGLRVARWMVERGARHLVLTGVHPVESRADRIRELSASGAVIWARQADVTDPGRMAGLFAEIDASGAPLRGVVHLAGLPENRPIRDTVYSRDQVVLGPKVMGAWMLHELTRHRPLDFFAAFSSIAAVWGSRGQPIYAAANHFLDALGHHRRSLGLPALIVNWGPWAEGGMVISAADQAYLARMGVRTMYPSEAIAAFDFLLSSGRGRQVVARVDWRLFKELFETRGSRPFLEHLGAPEAPATGPGERTAFFAEVTGLDSSGRRTRLAEWLTTEIGRVLGMKPGEPLPPGRGFFELGMDSLMAIEIKNRLQALLGVPLKATVVFNYSNVADLTAYLDGVVVGQSASSPAPASIESLSPEELINFLDRDASGTP